MYGQKEKDSGEKKNENRPFEKELQSSTKEGTPDYLILSNQSFMRNHLNKSLFFFGFLPKLKLILKQNFPHSNYILFIFSKVMLKEIKNTFIKKPIVYAPVKKNRTNDESQNVKPSTAFNTKGYFTSDQPYDPQYLKVKQQVFKKYRKDEPQVVFIDPKMTKPSAFIHRGMLKPNNQIYNQSLNSEKNYINRKERREILDEEKYFGKKRDSFTIGEGQPGATIKSSRPSTRSVYSRISTARSIHSSSNKQN